MEWKRGFLRKGGGVSSEAMIKFYIMKVTYLLDIFVDCSLLRIILLPLMIHY